MNRIVADIGNSRLKWSRVSEPGAIRPSLSLPVDAPSLWSAAFDAFDPTDNVASSWAVASVNPPVTDGFDEFLRARGIEAIRWYRSAADVPVRHALRNPEQAGSDRALAVVGAIDRKPSGRPLQIVLCGTALTVEWVSSGGVWLGGAIAPGLSLCARALHKLTAQLPEVIPSLNPSPLGDSTRPALEAGITWGVVGAIRELLARQAATFGENPVVVWSGGDAPHLAPLVCEHSPDIIPDLVLHGLARVAFPAESTAI